MFEVNGIERTDAGFLADSLSRLAQVFDGILVVAEALIRAQIGAILELGGVDAVHSGGLAELGFNSNIVYISITYSTVKVVAAHLGTDASHEESGSNEGTHLEIEAFSSWTKCEKV